MIQRNIRTLTQSAPLEQYRLNYNTEPGYPAQWLDNVVSQPSIEAIAMNSTDHLWIAD